MTPDAVAAVLSLYATWGQEHYDEEITQLAHAEQTAALAVRDAAADALIAAALLHDVGHLLHLQSGHRVPHERAGAAHLASLFPPAVTQPIALHVDAKRYLCAVDVGYRDGLSAGSLVSLGRQGGPMSLDEADAFAARSGMDDAVRLRRWDDTAKVDGLLVAPLASYEDLLVELAL